MTQPMMELQSMAESPTMGFQGSLGPRELFQELTQTPSQSNRAYQLAPKTNQHQQQTPEINLNMQNSQKEVGEKLVRYICAECGSPFTHPVSLKNHKVTAHMTQLRGTGFKCDQCPHDLYFNTNKRLLRHMGQFHTKHNPFRCKECPFSSSAEDIMEVHVEEIHRNSRNHLCFCGFATSQRGFYDYHIKCCSFIQ